MSSNAVSSEARWLDQVSAHVSLLLLFGTTIVVGQGLPVSYLLVGLLFSDLLSTHSRISQSYAWGHGPFGY